MSKQNFSGVMTALVTPFKEDLSVDVDAFRRLVARQLDAGVAGLVPCGTTGETPTLTRDEWMSVVKACVEETKGRVPVIPGSGTNNTRESVERTRTLKELGADAALVVTPYYNKPNPEGLLEHYRAIANEGGLPIVFYNVPSRTGLNAPPSLVLHIAREVPHVVAVKEASGNIDQAFDIVRERHEGFALLSGEDHMTCPMTLMGGDGVISVVSNVDPAGTVKMVEAARKGDVETARAEHYRLLELIRALFSETNPVPSKAALEELGLCSARVRPPLAAASSATRQRVSAALKGARVS